MGRRGSGSPDMTLCSWDGTWFKGGKMVAAVREGSSKPLPWPFGPHVSGVGKTQAALRTCLLPSDNPNMLLI